MSIFMYADDLVLLSASVAQLQTMITICADELQSLDMTINVNKSCCIRFGKRNKFVCTKLKMNNHDIEWREQL